MSLDSAQPLDLIKTRTESKIQEVGSKRVSIAFRDLGSGASLFIDEDRAFHPASTFKVCVMMELYRRAYQGDLSLDEEILVKNEFASLADGEPFSVPMEDDSDQILYRQIGKPESLREINRLMIVRSGNLATNLLVELLGAERITAFMSELGAPTLKVLRGPEDNRAFRQGLNNSVTAGGLSHVLTRLARGEVGGKEASQAMVEVMLAQEFNEAIPAGLPTGSRVAHKTGWMDGICHDAGIVFIPNRAPFVLVVLTEGISSKEKAQKLVAEIASQFC